MNWQRQIGLLLIVLGIAVLTLKLSHTYDPAPALEKLSAKVSPSFAKTVHRLQPERVVYGGLVIIPVLLGALLFAVSKSGSKSSGKTATEEVPEEPVLKAAKKAAKPAAIHSCNVLEVASGGRKLWQFDARNGNFSLAREQIALAGEALPPKLVAKDWTNLFQRRLNVAWLPAENVFLRVAQFPQGEFSETLAMVELQLEKLSPMPVTQIVWSIHVLPHATGNMQTVIVIIVARNIVEEFLGQLEGQGYLADRIELPVLDQLQATAVTADGAWIYPDYAGGPNKAMAAWWYGGVLQNLDLITLPATNRPASLKEQLMQMAWAGELEGWLTAPPRWHLVAQPATAAEWEAPLREGLGQSIQVDEPRPTPQLAASTAQRAAHADSRANLLPTEFSTRYQQQFVDRLWMRSLLAVGGIYIVGVLIYLVALNVALYRTRAVETSVAILSTDYTNTMQLRDKLQVLTDRQDLKFAALDCWKAVAELMPESLTLDTWGFSDGKRLTLNGSAPAGQAQEALDFHSALRKAPAADGKPLFDLTAEDDYNTHPVAGGGLSWGFTLSLKRSEAL
jgi:hypothetical protein